MKDEDLLWDKYKDIVFYQASKYARKYPTIHVEEFESLGMYAFAKCTNKYEELSPDTLRFAVKNEYRNMFQKLLSQGKKDNATIDYVLERESNYDMPNSFLKNHMEHLISNSELNIREKQVINGVFYKGKSRRQMSIEIGISPARADQLYFIGLKKLRKKYKEVT